jgi:hypothetical protein
VLVEPEEERLPSPPAALPADGELEEDFTSTWADVTLPRRLWVAQNPEYDPGPPPPPRPPREPAAAEDSASGTSPSRRRKANTQVFSNALPIERAARHGPGSSPPGPRQAAYAARPPRHASHRSFGGDGQPRSASPAHTHMRAPHPRPGPSSYDARPRGFNGPNRGRGQWTPPASSSQTSNTDVRTG